MSATLKKGKSLIDPKQVDLELLGETASVCPNEEDCGKDCSLVNVTNSYHPGTKDSIVNF